MRVITFKADEELIEKIDLIARETGRSRSDIIRYAIITYIRELEGRDKVLHRRKSLEEHRRKLVYRVLLKE